MDYIELTVSTTTAGGDLVSDKLICHGAVGTQIIDRADVPDPAKPNGYWELIDQSLIDAMPEDVKVKAWFEASDAAREQIASLKSDLASLPSLAGNVQLGALTITLENVKEADWAEEWKKYYKPFKAGKTLVVKPTWEHYDANPGDKIIEIDPGMAFGTGTHETTSMCMEFLEAYVKPDMRVIDVGTGSGILGIGAALLGAKDVLAIDIDPMAVKVAKENVLHNHLSDVVTVKQGDLLKQVDETCDLCVANIIADVICFFAQPLKSHIAKNGIFICSGIIKEREDDVLAALKEADYTILDKHYKGEWVAIACRR